MKLDWENVLPPELFRRPQAATRYPYGREQTGRITVAFQAHEVLADRRPVIHALPRELDRDPAYKTREDDRIYGMSLILQGCMEIGGIARQKRSVQAGEILQINFRRMQEVRLTPGEGCFECSLSVDGHLGARLCDLGLWDPERQVFAAPNPPGLLRIYHDLFAKLLDPRSSTNVLFQGVLALLQSAYESVESSAGEEFRRQACALIAHRSGPGDRLPDLASEMGMTYATFRRRFRETVGMSPSRYQLMRRMENARVLLQNHTVQETALLLGYSDPFVFSRQFRKVTGHAPKDLRSPRNSAADTP